MSNELVKCLADYVRRNYRLDGVPLPVIEEVLRQGIERLAEIVPAECDASEVSAIEFEHCESCCNLIDPQKPRGALMDSEGIWVCPACHEDGGPRETA